MKEDTLHMGMLIKQKLDEQERSVSWLAKKLNRNSGSLNRLLCQNHLHAELLLRVSLILGEDLFACYSQILKEEKQAQKKQ